MPRAVRDGRAALAWPAPVAVVEAREVLDEAQLVDGPAVLLAATHGPVGGWNGIKPRRAAPRSRVLNTAVHVVLLCVSPAVRTQGERRALWNAAKRVRYLPKYVVGEHVCVRDLRGAPSTPRGAVQREAHPIE